MAAPKSYRLPADLREAIKSRRKELGLSQERLAELVGVKKQTISDIEKGKTKDPRGSHFVKLMQELGLEGVKILSGSLLRVSPGNLQLAEGTKIPGAADQGSEMRELPLITWKEVSDWETRRRRFVRSDAEVWMPFSASGASSSSFILKMKGPSMDPEVKDEEFIFVDPSLQPQDGDLVIAIVSGSEEPILRKLISEGGRRYLQATNTSWPVRIIEVTESTIFCGVVFFQGRLRGRLPQR